MRKEQVGGGIIRKNGVQFYQCFFDERGSICNIAPFYI